MNWGEVLIASIVGLPSITIAVLAYRRSRKVDAVSEKLGITANGRAGTAQIIEGLNSLIDQLQEENGRLRIEATNRATRLESMTLEIARLRKRYGENGP